MSDVREEGGIRFEILDDVEHPNWTPEEVRAEVARRISHGAVDAR